MGARQQICRDFVSDKNHRGSTSDILNAMKYDLQLCHQKLHAAESWVCLLEIHYIFSLDCELLKMWYENIISISSGINHTSCVKNSYSLHFIYNFWTLVCKT
jgi:hypothetical protein